MLLGAYIDISELTRQMANGNVSARKHPRYPLTILNYTTTAMGQTHDNQTLRRCRGLIYDHETMEIIARPMEAFFNINDDRYADTKFETLSDVHGLEITEKMDGSMGIVYQYKENRPEVATRGSFESEQANWATEYLQRNCGTLMNAGLGRDVTIIVEIIYPENQIVIDYKGKADLTLLAIINTDTGAEFSHRELRGAERLLGLSPVKLYDKTAAQCTVENERNREGYVFKFYVGKEKTPRRVKVKFQDYTLAHRAMFGIHNRDVWEVLAAGKNFDLAPFLGTCPEPLIQWLSHTATELKFKFQRINRRADFLVEFVRREFPSATRKGVADFFKDNAYFTVAGEKWHILPILFAKYDNKPHTYQFKPGDNPSRLSGADVAIWRMLRPERAEGFKGIVAGHHDLPNGGNHADEECHVAAEETGDEYRCSRVQGHDGPCAAHPKKSH